MSINEEKRVKLPVTLPPMTNLYQLPAADSTISKFEGSAVNPVSSKTSRLKASYGI